MNVPLLFTVLSSLWLIMHLLFYKTIKHEHILIYYAWASNCVFLFLVDVLSIIALSGIKNHLIIAFALTFMFSFLTVCTLTASYIYYVLIISKNKIYSIIIFSKIICYQFFTFCIVGISHGS